MILIMTMTMTMIMISHTKKPVSCHFQVAGDTLVAGVEQCAHSGRGGEGLPFLLADSHLSSGKHPSWSFRVIRCYVCASMHKINMNTCVDVRVHIYTYI